MNNLIEIKITDNKQTVLGRDLHKFLEVGKDYTTWVKEWSEYDFINNKDYITFYSVKSGDTIFPGFQEFNEIVDMSAIKRARLEISTNHQLTLNTAKEISMIQRSDKGKQARLYFIKCEEELKNKQIQLFMPSYQIDNPVDRANRWIEEYKEREQIEKKLLIAEIKIEEQKPLMDFVDTIIKSKDNILVRELAKVASDNGIIIGEKKLYKQLRDWKMIMADSTEPYQTYINNKCFVTEERLIRTPYGDKITFQTLVTPKGQIKIIEKLRKNLDI